ncbi:hypothetical protein GGX14DRAFT_440371 [Mycena pura]|uniref:Uncharacterized protein n=1 Tax=Mycena pura TaxID=153505 RepID=A0AAD6VLX8_9AGAR|nr:hypothetical protein GGX14DRAFT_440371 [Mycena pura]
MLDETDTVKELASKPLKSSGSRYDRKSPLEDIFHEIIAEKAGHRGDICDVLIDGLVDACVDNRSPSSVANILFVRGNKYKLGQRCERSTACSRSGSWGKNILHECTK